ncbi:MAG: rlmD [Panacagrimonas sp.]|jgi:23S rRNA (uracil1939-C5)-methyltransferase|nr:23S rRNA (uracil(1939)-C(5))-methyltransferase RlmD [Panacagrimonas sp.]MCC2655892.1 rlmD [Panacagrimonas sp.]
MSGFRGTPRRRKALPEGEFEAAIVDLAEDGRGVARIDGKVCFIHGALPGETVKFRYTRVHRDADEGETAQVLTASPDRVEPPCAHFGVCGGCALQHLAPGAQIALKQRQMLEALRRIGKVEPESVAAPITGPTLGYRRRARLGAKYVDKRGTALVGFRERASPFLAALESCQVLDPRVGRKLQALGECISQLSIRRDLPQIEIASAGDGPADGPVALVLRVLKPPSDSDRERLSQLARDHGFTLYLQSGGPNSVAPLTPPAPGLLYDPDGGRDRLRFLPTDFIQVNGPVSRQAVRQAIDWLDPAPGAAVLELFCGLGNFSVPLARRGARVTAVEGDAGLVDRARANAQVAGLEVLFHTADLFQPRPEAPWRQGSYDAVLLDPPRAGAEAMMPVIGALRPARVVYVSCHPGTLARDAGLLVHEHGYRLARAGVMDMFPHTTHVESMVLFERD